MSGRSIVLYTGQLGYDQFTDMLDKANLISIINYVYEEDGLPEDEREMLIQMINSDDPADLLIAKLYLNSQHGYTFHTPGT